MKKLFVAFLALLIFAQCETEDDLGVEFSQETDVELAWRLDSLGVTNIQSVSTFGPSQMEISFTSDSLCPDGSMEFSLVSLDGAVNMMEALDTFPQVFIYTFDESQEFKLSSNLKLSVDATFACFQLGAVDCRALITY